MTYGEAIVRASAARWAAALLEFRPEDTIDEQEALVENLQRHASVTPPEIFSALWSALERDDEDTNETARLVFEALGKAE